METAIRPEFEALPGAELIEEGLRDLACGAESIGSLLVEIVAPNLVEAGIALPPKTLKALDAEERLYTLLGREHGANAHSQYNAYVRRADKFCRALALRKRSEILRHFEPAAGQS